MEKLFVVALNSLLAAGLYATMSYGLAVIYGVMRIINLAHAGLMMLGAYATFTLNDRFGLDPFLSLLVVAPAFFLLGMALYATVVRRLPRSSTGPSMESLLLLFGVWLVLQNLAYAIWGGDTQSILTPYTMKSVGAFGERVRSAADPGLRGERALPGGAEPRAPAHLPGQGHPGRHPEPRRGHALRSERRAHLRGGLRDRDCLRRRRRDAC